MMPLDETHDPARRSWVDSANAAGCDFPIQNLPFGVFRAAGAQPRGGVAMATRSSTLPHLQKRSDSLAPPQSLRPLVQNPRSTR